MHRPFKKTNPKKRREAIIDRYLHETPLYEIAEQFVSSVEEVLQYVSDDLRQKCESRSDETDEATEHEIQKLNRLEREAWRAWFRSQQQAESVKIRSADGDKKSAEKSTKTQTGDVRYLSMIEKCIAKRIALLRLGRSKSASSGEKASCVSPDPKWYGNNAHDKNTPGAAPSNSDSSFPRPLQSGGLRPPLGQDGLGPNGGD